MDHLWLDPEVQLEPDLVPYYGSVRYERCGNFATWPEQFGISSTELRTSLLSDSRDGDLSAASKLSNSVVQESLFFGLLSQFCEILEVEFRRGNLITERDGAQILTTRSLYKMAEKALADRAIALAPVSQRAKLQSTVRRLLPFLGTEGSTSQDPTWQGSFQSMSDAKKVFVLQNPKGMALPPRKQDQGTLEQILSLVRTSSKFLNSCYEVVPQDEKWVPNVNWLSCWILVESLAQLAQNLFNVTLRVMLAQDYIVKLSSFWGQRCQRLGICPQRMEHLVQYANPVTQVYIATSLYPWNGGEHDECVVGRYCTATAKAESLPLHTADCSSSGGGTCFNVTLRPTKRAVLEQKIESEGYGVLQFTNSLPESADNCVASIPNKDRKYVAFSHVWSHGLGNYSANALPECQLIRLKAILKRADCESHGFWLDPICVPLNSSWKRKAIECMDRVYKAAAKVLVLDNRLVKARGTNISKAIHLILSDWITRLWTLQDTVLPGSKLYVVFADQIVPMHNIIWDWQEFDTSAAKNEIISCSTSSVLGSLVGIMGSRLLGIAESFQCRVATRIEDQFLCLAILTGVELSKLPARPTMSDVIGMLPKIEQDLLFAPGARCSVPGFRWCPSALMTLPSGRGYFGEQIRASIGRLGIRMVENIVQLGTIDFRPSTPFTKPADQQHFLLYAKRDDASPYRVLHLDRSAELTAEQLRPRRLVDAALIMESTPEHEEMGLKKHMEYIAAVLVSGMHRQGRELSARYECPVVTVEYQRWSELTATNAPEGYEKVITGPMKHVKIWVD